MSDVVSVCGLDVSLSASGFALKYGNSVLLDTIKTKPESFPNDLARFRYICDEIMKRIPKNIGMICIEDFFTPRGPSVGAAIRLAMLGSIVRLALYEAKMPFFVVSPMSLKKHITGKGVGEKNLILREIYKRHGIECKDDDQADACALSFLAEHLYININKNKIDIPAYQKEVVDKLIESQKERGYNIDIKPHL